MSIDISSRFNYERLFRFVLPSVVMMIFISTYTMVDGFFVSNYVGKTAFTAVNLIFPAIMVFACVGFMFGSGGSALVGVIGHFVLILIPMKLDIVWLHRYFILFLRR